VIEPGPVVIASFVGAVTTKIRPVVVLASPTYQQHRPDLIIGLLTSRRPSPLTPLDHALLDWTQANLAMPTYFRCYLGMCRAVAVRPVGRLSPRDWAAVQACLRRAVIA